MTASPNIGELLRKLDEHQQAFIQHQQLYLKTSQAVHDALAQSIIETVPNPAVLAPNAPSRRHRRSTVETETERPLGAKPRTYHSSVLTGESDESDQDDELYVQIPLPEYTFDHEDLRRHLKIYNFEAAGSGLLSTVVRNGRLLNPALFPEYPAEEKWHNSHYSVFDVGTDGSPLSRREVVKPGTKSIDSAIWQAVQDLNADPVSQRKAVGRITIVREPSPIILGALHLTMNRDFDMDELFGYLYHEGDTKAYVTDRAFLQDRRQQKSFAFKFDYFTVVGEEAEPMPWQRTDAPDKINKSPEHIPISRCSSVVALSLVGDPVRKLRNVSRGAKQEYGHVFDSWAPWQVINLQCYPDHKHSMDSHDSTKHYVNGPEAFLHTLLAEFKDAEKRFGDIYNKISKLVIPPADFMFDGKLRDKLLFEDAEFTYSRRYFWAYQTLGIMNHGIKSLIDAYEDTFTAEFWNGTHKYLFPMIDKDSARNVYWRKRMVGLKAQFEKEIKHLEKLFEENDDRRKEIRTLRDQLFSGTSVLESRKSVELSEVTILQGHNIKLLTLVSIFFLPLTFVTSVFGMTNMPQEHQFKAFGVVMAVVCVPFFLLIGTLNTTYGMRLFQEKSHQFFSWIKRAGRKQVDEPKKGFIAHETLTMQKRTLSESHAIKIRKEQIRPPSLARKSTSIKGLLIRNGGGTVLSPKSAASPLPYISSPLASPVQLEHGNEVRKPEKVHMMEGVGIGVSQPNSFVNGEEGEKKGRLEREREREMEMGGLQAGRGGVVSERAGERSSPSWWERRRRRKEREGRSDVV